jgi:site-specific DNA recombinase
MLDAIRGGKYGGIIAWHPDRLARNMKEAGEVIDLLDKRIIKDLRFVSFSFENTTAGKMLLGMTFVLSKQYSDQLSDNVSRGNRRSIDEGKYINRAKHGYYKDRNQYLRPDSDNFVLIKQAFHMRLAGKTLDEIAAYLNEKGYSRRQKDGSYRLFKMTKQKVDKFLVDPAYTGVVRYGKNVVDLSTKYDFTPVITVEEFQGINKLSRNQVFRLARRFRKPETVKADLLRGMVICAECGEPMIAGITAKKAKDGITRYFYYRCDTEDCSRHGKSMRAKVIVDYVCDFLKKKPFSAPGSYEHYVKEMGAVSAKRQRDAKSTIASLEARKRTLQNRHQRTKELLLSDDDPETRAAFRGDLKKIAADLRNVDSEIKKGREAIAANKGSVLTHAEFLELMEKLPKILHGMKTMADIDFAIRKMYLNFTVNGKNVVKATLCQPFDELYTLTVPNGGHGETRTPNPYGTRF